LDAVRRSGRLQGRHMAGGSAFLKSRQLVVADLPVGVCQFRAMRMRQTLLPPGFSILPGNRKIGAKSFGKFSLL
jgi:hypothetical protein